MREIERWMDPKKMDQQWKHRERWIKVAAGGGGGDRPAGGHAARVTRKLEFADRWPALEYGCAG